MPIQASYIHHVTLLTQTAKLLELIHIYPQYNLKIAYLTPVLSTYMSLWKNLIKFNVWVTWHDPYSFCCDPGVSGMDTVTLRSVGASWFATKLPFFIRGNQLCKLHILYTAKFLGLKYKRPRYVMLLDQLLYRKKVWRKTLDLFFMRNS